MLTTLAPALVHPGDYSAADLCAMVGCPPTECATEGGHLLRRARRRGWVEPTTLALGPAMGEPGTQERRDAVAALGSRVAVAIVERIESGYQGSAEGLCAAMAADGVLRLKANGRPPSSWSRLLRRLRDAQVLADAGVVLTPAGAAAVMADPDAAAVVARERAELARLAAAVEAARVQAVEAHRRQAEAIAPPRAEVRRALCEFAWADAVVIEQVESYGIPGNSLLLTAEVSGRFRQRAIDSFGVVPVLMPRREVKRVLGVVGGGADGQVREAMLARHGGTKQAAQGRKKAPGPLYGLSSHAWQALGLVVAWLERESAVGAWCAGCERPVAICNCGGVR